MRKQVFLLPFTLLALTACDSDKQNSRSDTDPVTTKGEGFAPAERDPTPQTGTGGDRETQGPGLTQQSN